MKQSAAIESRPEDLLQFEFASARERATWVYGMLRSIMDVPRALRTARLEQLTARIDEHPHRDDIRAAFREFWSHHSYVRVISEAGLPDEAFLVRELFARAVRHLLPVDEVEGDLYVLMDSLDLRESDARWLSPLPDSHVTSWADIFCPPTSS